MHTGAPTGGVHQDQGGVWRRQRPQRRLLPPVRQGGRPRDGIGGGGRSAEGALLWWKRCGKQASARSLSGTLGSGSGCPKLRRAANTNQLGSRWPATPALCSAQARRQVERERAARRAQESAANTEAREEREERAREQARSGAKAKADAQARGSFGGGTGSGAGGGAARREVVFDLDLQRRGTFAEYEVDFQAFLTRAHREALVPRHVPLPPRGQAIGPATSLAEWQQNTKRALLRWHPDKWAARMQALGEVEAAQLKQLTEGMFRAVSRAKERGFLPQRWAARAD